MAKAKHTGADAPRMEADEVARMRRLEEYDIIGTSPEREYDDIARLAADALNAPIALLCLTERDRHWFKAHIGTDLVEVPRSESFCDHAMRDDRVFVVPDASADPRFRDYPLVAGPPGLRFYAGKTIVAADGHQIGTLCVCDTEPRSGIDARQTRALESLARLAADRLELRRHQLRMQLERHRAAEAEAEARRAHERLRDTIEMVPQALVFRDADDRYVLWNQRYAELYSDIADLLKPGISYEEILRASLDRGNHVEAIDDKEAWLANRLAKRNGVAPIREQKLRDGRWLRIEERQTADGGVVGVHIDITELKTREAHFRLLFEGNPLPMFVFDRSSLVLLAVNQAMIDQLGYDRDALIGMNVLALHAQDERDTVRTVIGSDRLEMSPVVVRRYISAGGSIIHALPYRQVIDYHGTSAVLVALVDVTERIAAEERVSYLAHHDTLTGLPNRAAFEARLDGAVSEARRTRTNVGLCLIDIDHFKDINDTLGHGAGDAVLRFVADHLRQAVRTSDFIARLGGDEFAVILPDISGDRALEVVSKRLLGLDAVRLKEVALPAGLSASIGIARFPADAWTAEQLIQNADIALYRSKTSGRARLTVFDSELRRRIHERINLKNRFRQAIRAGEIMPYYQAIIDLDSGRVCGLEALARWRHPDRGVIAAGAFADVFEDAELSAELGLAMLERSTDDMQDWERLRLPYCRIGLNVTAGDLRLPGFVDEVLATLSAKRLDPTRLLVEVTENVVIDREDGLVITALNELARHGLRIALDDFGTGHASLTHLKKVDVFSLKIDQSFVRNLVGNREDRAIVNAVIGLGASLGIRTVAEGIETIEQAAMLRAAGCTAGQGYLFSRPIPAGEVPRLVTAYADTPWSPAANAATRVA